MSQIFIKTWVPTESTKLLQVPSTNDINSGQIYTIGNPFTIKGADIASYIRFLNSGSAQFSTKNFYEHFFAPSGLFPDQLNVTWEDISNAYVVTPNNNELAPIFDVSLVPSTQSGIWLYMYMTNPNVTTTLPNPNAYPQPFTYPLYGANNTNVISIATNSFVSMISNGSNSNSTIPQIWDTNIPGAILYMSPSQQETIESSSNGNNGVTFGSIFPNSNETTPVLISLTALDKSLPTNPDALRISEEYNSQRIQLLLDIVANLVHNQIGSGNVYTTITVTNSNDSSVSTITGWMTNDEVNGVASVLPNGNINGLITGTIIYTVNVNGVNNNFTPAGYVAFRNSTFGATFPWWGWLIIVVVVLLIIGLIWYFVARNKKKKQEEADAEAKRIAIIRKQREAKAAAAKVMPKETSIVIQQPSNIPSQTIPQQPVYIQPPQPQPIYIQPPQPVVVPQPQPIYIPQPSQQILPQSTYTPQTTQQIPSQLLPQSTYIPPQPLPSQTTYIPQQISSIPSRQISYMPSPYVG